MGGVPIASTALRLLVVATCGFQLALLLGAPVPSSVSSCRMRPRRSGPGFSDPAGPPTDTPFTLLLALGALAGLFLTLAAAVQPRLSRFLLPVGACFPGWLSQLSGACLLAGNALIGTAVFTLKRHTTFDAAGQSDRLVTGGIFAFIQHPIVSGMGLIYLGFFMALPSPLVLGGLICYGCHQHRRLAAEEGLLEKRFGRRYEQYRSGVGRFWPKGLGRGRRG